MTPYQGVPLIQIYLEIGAVILGLLSAFFASRNKVLVYPMGIISTLIFVYLLAKAGLLGDMIINAYFFIMSIYGWYYWSRSKNGVSLNPISSSTFYDFKVSCLIFFSSIVFIGGIYMIFDQWIQWTAYVDTFTTAIFFAGMWLMAKRKVEHWLFWIVGNLITIPLYFYKDLLISSLQYLILTLIAIVGYKAWKRKITQQTLSA
ncbi:MAG: nicotinamide riboside transporter PnuC [Flavobacteriaceae bacterium]|nr:nicotinamide riboside transporter PnuC [Flavobacteriaceae bacterium]